MDRIVTKANYFDLFDRLQDPLLIVNEECRVIDANPGAESFFCKSLEEIITTDWSFLFENIAQMQKEIRVSLRRYHPRVCERSIELNNQIKHLKIETCSLELSDGSKVVQLIIKDQTELVEARKQLEEKNKELEFISITDKLTLLYNRRHFDSCLNIEFERAERSNSAISLILFDVDNFKVYNDTNGHVPGDELLTELAQVIKNNIRQIDLPFRYGGEEFVILCPNTDSNSAYLEAERIRDAVMKHDFKFKEKQPLGFVSVSVGISSYPENVGSKTELKTLADDALYQSKKTGRNRSSIIWPKAA